MTIGQRRLLKAKNRHGRAKTANLQAIELQHRIEMDMRRFCLDQQIAEADVYLKANG